MSLPPDLPPVKSKPLANVSLDVDNLWCYQKIHGDAGWEARPSYLDTFVPEALGLLDQLKLRITFFIVGVDATIAGNVAPLRSIVAAGHELGNHSFEHEPWLHRYTRTQLEQEIDRTDAAIFAATGARTVGFRGPGFSWSPELIEVLAERGHAFDASTFPTYLGPLARAYYFWTSKLTPAEREERSYLYGGMREGLRSVKPYWWQLRGGRRLLELPVTTMPIVKAPFHLSYLLFLARYSDRLMLAYLHTALRACRLTGSTVSFLLHPLDIIGGDRVPQLAFFPGMDLPTARKQEVFLKVLRVLGDYYELLPMGEHARRIMAGPALPLRTPALA